MTVRIYASFILCSLKFWMPTFKGFAEDGSWSRHIACWLRVRGIVRGITWAQEPCTAHRTTGNEDTVEERGLPLVTFYLPSDTSPRSGRSSSLTKIQTRKHSAAWPPTLGLTTEHLTRKHPTRGTKSASLVLTRPHTGLPFGWPVHAHQVKDQRLDWRSPVFASIWPAKCHPLT